MRKLRTLLALITFALVLATGAMAETVVNETVVSETAISVEPAAEPAGSEEPLPSSRCGSQQDEALLPVLGTPGLPIAEVPASPECEGLCRCGGILNGCCQCPKGSNSGSCCADGACTIEGTPICFALGSCTCISPDPN